MPVEEQISLSRFTTMHVGGPARYFVRARDENDIREGLRLARVHNLPFFILGAGSNTLFSDEGFEGVVIHMEDRTVMVEGDVVVAGSGVFMRQLVTRALSANLRGLEELAGIPGTVGGAVRGNAGTWRTETKDVLKEVDVLMRDGEQWLVKKIRKEECQFGYRDSIFKRQREWVIVRAYFQLAIGDALEGKKRVAEDMRMRRERQPYEAPSSGSIFKNPDPAAGVFAGALLEEAGVKGLGVGGAQVSEKHANWILNTGKATSRDVLTLIDLMMKAVIKKRGITLEPEVIIVTTDLDT